MEQAGFYCTFCYCESQRQVFYRIGIPVSSDKNIPLAKRLPAQKIAQQFSQLLIFNSAFCVVQSRKAFFRFRRYFQNDGRPLFPAFLFADVEGNTSDDAGQIRQQIGARFMRRYTYSIKSTISLSVIAYPFCIAACAVKGLSPVLTIFCPKGCMFFKGLKK